MAEYTIIPPRYDDQCQTKFSGTLMVPGRQNIDRIFSNQEGLRGTQVPGVSQKLIKRGDIKLCQYLANECPGTLKL